MTDNIESTPLQALIHELGLGMTADFVPRSQTDNAKATKLHEMQIHWRVRITRAGRNADITTPYSMGVGHLPKSIQPPTRGASVDEYNATVNILESGRYWPGIRNTKLPPPSIADVLSSLVSDSEALYYASFDEWASNYGYDADSRKVEVIYRACLDIGLKLRRMLSDVELAKLREAFQDY